MTHLRFSGRTDTGATAEPCPLFTAGGEYLALRFSCEAASSFGDDIAPTEQAILGRIRAAAEAADISADLYPPHPWPDAPAGTALITALSDWAARCARPLVLFFDEIDSLRGDSLVNALAAEVIDEMRIESSITDEHIDAAKERLILARATHLDSLVDKLTDPRVRRIIEPLIAGGTVDSDPAFDDARSYAADLGLIAPDNPVRVANPIYKEVIVRVLGAGWRPISPPSPAGSGFPTAVWTSRGC